MKIWDCFFSEEPSFENRLMYAMLLSPYDCNCDSKWGYLDGCGHCLESHKPIEELEEYIKQYSKENSPLSEYDKAYVQAFKDFIKQERGNEKWEKSQV